MDLTVDEMPAHSHSGTTSWSDLQGEVGLAFNPNANYGNPSGKISYIGNFNGKVADGGNDDWGRRMRINVSHNHSFSTNNVGNNKEHNNLMPYISVMRWKRIR